MIAIGQGLFLCVLWISLQFVIVVFSDHTRFLLWQNVAPNIMLCGVVPNICQKHVQGLQDLPSSDYLFKMFDNFHCNITPLVLKIPIQWFVNFI